MARKKNINPELVEALELQIAKERRKLRPRGEVQYSKSLSRDRLREECNHLSSLLNAACHKILRLQDVNLVLSERLLAR